MKIVTNIFASKNFLFQALDAINSAKGKSKAKENGLQNSTTEKKIVKKVNKKKKMDSTSTLPSSDSTPSVDLISSLDAESRTLSPLVEARITTDDKMDARMELCLVCNSSVAHLELNADGLGVYSDEHVVFCHDCGEAYHTFCLDPPVVDKSFLKPSFLEWRCVSCKFCVICQQPHNEGQLVVCDHCDRCFHSYCAKLSEEEITGDCWLCADCRRCAHCHAHFSSVSSSTPALRRYALCNNCDKDYEDRIEPLANILRALIRAESSGEAYDPANLPPSKRVTPPIPSTSTKKKKSTPNSSSSAPHSTNLSRDLVGDISPSTLPVSLPSSLITSRTPPMATPSVSSWDSPPMRYHSDSQLTGFGNPPFPAQIEPSPGHQQPRSYHGPSTQANDLASPHRPGFSNGDNGFFNSSSVQSERLSVPSKLPGSVSQYSKISHPDSALPRMSTYQQLPPGYHPELHLALPFANTLSGENRAYGSNGAILPPKASSSMAQSSSFQNSAPYHLPYPGQMMPYNGHDMPPSFSHSMHPSITSSGNPHGTTIELYSPHQIPFAIPGEALAVVIGEDGGMAFPQPPSRVWRQIFELSPSSYQMICDFFRGLEPIYSRFPAFLIPGGQFPIVSECPAPDHIMKLLLNGATPQTRPPYLLPRGQPLPSGTLLLPPRELLSHAQSHDQSLQQHPATSRLGNPPPFLPSLAISHHHRLAGPPSNSLPPHHQPNFPPPKLQQQHSQETYLSSPNFTTPHHPTPTPVDSKSLAFSPTSKELKLETKASVVTAKKELPTAAYGEDQTEPLAGLPPADAASNIKREKRRRTPAKAGSHLKQLGAKLNNLLMGPPLLFVLETHPWNPDTSTIESIPNYAPFRYVGCAITPNHVAPSRPQFTSTTLLRYDIKDPYYIDKRVCSLCRYVGDHAILGRLLPLQLVDEWVHSSCAVWAAEVFPSESGELTMLYQALRKANKTHCFSCKAVGASVVCAIPACGRRFHLPCLLKSASRMVSEPFIRYAICPEHATRFGKVRWTSERRDANSAVPVELQPQDGPAGHFNMECLDTFCKLHLSESDLRMKIAKHEGEVSLEEWVNYIFRCGALTVKRLGCINTRGPFHNKDYIFPSGYRALRRYWSCKPGSSDPISSSITDNQASTATKTISRPFASQPPRSTYEIQIFDDEPKLKFSLTCLDDPHDVLISSDLDTLWNEVVYRVNVMRSGTTSPDTDFDASSDSSATLGSRRSRPPARLNSSQIANHLPSTFFLGLELTHIASHIERLPGARDLVNYRRKHDMVIRLPSVQAVAVARYFDPDNYPDILNAPANESGAARCQPYVPLAPMARFRQLDAFPDHPATALVQFKQLARTRARYNQPLYQLPQEAHIRGSINSHNVGSYSKLTRFKLMKASEKVRLKVLRSKIQGRGLFVMEDACEGEFLIEYVGEMITHRVADEREKRYQSRGIGCYMFSLSKEFVIDATMQGNHSRFINHSCEPNCDTQIEVIDGTPRIVITAKHALRQGEELTYDYHFEPENEKLTCYCGAPSCRGFMN